MVVTENEKDFAEEIIRKFKEDNLGIDVVSQLYAAGTLQYELSPSRTIELMVKVLEAEECEDEDVFSTIAALSSILAVQNAEDFAGTVQPGETIEMVKEEGLPSWYFAGRKPAPLWQQIALTTVEALALIGIGAVVGYKAGQYVSSKRNSV